MVIKIEPQRIEATDIKDALNKVVAYHITALKEVCKVNEAECLLIVKTNDNAIIQPLISNVPDMVNILEQLLTELKSGKPPLIYSPN